MNFEQRPYRSIETDESSDEPWLADEAPDGEPGFDTFVLAADDQEWRSSRQPRTAYHAVVEDIYADQVMFGIAPWPTLDASGRLQFLDTDEYPPGIDDPSAPTATYPLADAQQVVDRFRSQPRPLRIGDVFRVETETFSDVNDWSSAMDVSSHAREVAKIAQRAAAQQAANTDTARILNLAPPGDDTINADPDSGEFGPNTVQSGV